MKYFFISIFLLAAGISSNAQTESAKDSAKALILEEVQIQSGFDFNSQNNKTKRKDGQARTERLLENIPGVSIISRGAFAQEPVIRGLSDGQIQVNINGMKVFGACTDRMDPSTSYIEPNNLQSIKLNNGPGFEVGAATIGGSLNFTLKEPEVNAAKMLEGYAGTGFESNATAKQILGGIQYSRKRIAFTANAIYKKAENYTPGGNKNDLRNSFSNWTKEKGFSVDENARVRFSQYEKWNAGFGLKLLLNENNTLLSNLIIDRANNIGYPALTMDVAFANAGIASVNYKYFKANRKVQSIESSLYFNRVNHAMDDTKRPAEQIIMHMDMPGYSWTAGHFTKTSIQLPHQNLQFKIENYLNRWHAEMTMYGSSGAMFMLTIPDAQRWVTGLDVADKIHLNNVMSLVAGTRLEVNLSSVFSDAGKNQLTGIYSGNPNRNNFLWNAYLQGIFDLSQQWQATLKFAKASRPATLKELYSVYLLNRVDDHEYIGNPSLENEAALNFDASVNYKSAGVVASVKGFSYLFKNYIAGTVVPGVTPTMGATGVKQYSNISGARISGGEAFLQINPFRDISVSSVNTYQSGIDNNKNHLPMISPFHSTNKIEWAPGDNWNVFAESVYAAAQNNVSPFYGEKPTPAFNVMNAGFVKAFQLPKQRIVASLTGLNIFNQYYYEHTDVIKLPRQGMNFVVHITIYF